MSPSPALQLDGKFGTATASEVLHRPPARGESRHVRRFKRLVAFLCLSGTLYLVSAAGAGRHSNMPMTWKHQLKTLLGLSFFTSGFAIPSLADAVQGEVGTLVWGSCSDGNRVLAGAECGYAFVPLDYLDKSAGMAKIALGRYNATASPRKGAVFVNPGGPGGPGVSLATRAGAELQQIIGKDYDIIGFDPRGIGQTEPATRCFPSPEARTAFIANTVLDRGYDIGPNLTDPSNEFHLLETQREADALYKTQFAICGQTMGDQLRYMGTSTVARDIDYLTTLLDGEDALINFYGLSYGTVIGQYLVNMFPDRVGRVAIDGVVDADVWANQPPYAWWTWLTGTDRVYEIMFDECAEVGPSECALAKSSQDTGSDIMARVESFLEQLYESPLAVPNATIPGILTNGRARLYLLSALEVPQNWPTMTAAFAAAMAGDGSAVLDSVNDKDLIDLERSAVSCNDQKPIAPPTAEVVVNETLWATENVSRFTLAVIISEPDSGCQFWPVTPPERYLGPWNHTLNSPVLIISNTHDPVTPLSNGKIVHAALGSSSALLIQDGPGHTSLALPSSCSIAHIQAYFADGTLPVEGTVCPIDMGPFPTLDELATQNGRFKFDAIRKHVFGS